MMNDFIKKNGVYKIVNKINGNTYYGSVSGYGGFYVRWHNHKKDLIKNKHHSTHLQHAWNKYGAENFEFIIILICIPENCLYYKQLFLDKYWDDGKTCYNINKRAESAFGIKRSEEFKKRVSDGHADVSGSKNPMWGKPCSEERKRKISERVRGSNQGSAILDENKIEEIKNYILNTDMTQKEIATIFGVGYTVIAHMLGGKSWKHCFSNEELLFIKNKAEKNKIKRLADLHTGETSKTAKLNNEKIEKIKFLILNTDMNLRQIAHKIQVNPTTISHILAGDAWKQNLTNEERDILKEKVKKNAKIHRRRSNV